MRHWKCNKKLSVQIWELQGKRQLVFEKFAALAKSVGAIKDVIPLQGDVPYAFFFKSDPGPDFKIDKKKIHSKYDAYIPKSRKLKQQLRELRDTFRDDVEKLINFKMHLEFGDGGVYISHIGITKAKGSDHYYITTHDKYSPIAGMRRVSDTTFEKATA